MAGRTETEGDDDPGLDTVEELVKAGASLSMVSKNLQGRKQIFNYRKTRTPCSLSITPPCGGTFEWWSTSSNCRVSSSTARTCR